MSPFFPPRHNSVEVKPMGVFMKSRSGADKKGNGSSRQTVYVWLASDEAIFLINGEVRESKYSYGVPIVPLYGKYRSTKNDRVYDADELRDYDVILNVSKDADIDELKGKRLAVIGFDESEVLIENEEDEGGEG